MSIYHTLSADLEYCWSSKPSKFSDTNEYLIYKLPSRQRVNSVIITAYKLPAIDGGGTYPPLAIQIEV